MIEEAKKPVRLVWVPHIFTPNSHHLLGRPWEYHKASVGRSRGHHHCSTWSHVLLYLTTCTHKHLGCVPAAYSHRTCVLFTPKYSRNQLNHESARRVTGRRRSRETSLRLVFCAAHHPSHPWSTTRREYDMSHDRYHTWQPLTRKLIQTSHVCALSTCGRPRRRHRRVPCSAAGHYVTSGHRRAGPSSRAATDGGRCTLQPVPNGTPRADGGAAA